MEITSDLIVRVASGLALVTILAQLFNEKGGRAHVNLGLLGLANVAVLFVAVMYRGYIQWGQPHGALYPVHVGLGLLFFVAYAYTVYFGLKARHAPRMMQKHRTYAWLSVLLVLLSLGAGIASFMLNRNKAEASHHERLFV